MKQTNKYWKNYTSLAKKEEIKEYEDKYNNYIKTLEEDNQSQPVTQEEIYQDTNKESEALTELIITILLGFLGVHKFMQKTIILYLLTLGLFYIGWIHDIIKTAQKYKESKK